MTEITVETPDETPDNDTDIVVAPTIVVAPPVADETPAVDAVEEIAEEVADDVTDTALALAVGNLTARVEALEAANVAPPVITEIDVDKDGDTDVVIVDDGPTGPPWTHKPFGFGSKS